MMNDAAKDEWRGVLFMSMVFAFAFSLGLWCGSLRIEHQLRKAQIKTLELSNMILEEQINKQTR